MAVRLVRSLVTRFEEEFPEHAPPGWTPRFKAIRKLDRIWFLTEWVVAALMFLAMGLVMFATVLAEVFTTRREWLDVVILYPVVLLAVRSRAVKEGERPLGFPIQAGIAAVITGAIIGLVLLYVDRYPGGFIWAQKLALVLMMWIAMIGASMATYDRSHLALEMGEKLWPAKLLPMIKAAAHAVTSGFCVLFLVMSLDVLSHQRQEASLIATFESFETWQAFLVVPYAFAAMAVRFLAQAFTAASGSAEPMEERLPT